MVDIETAIELALKYLGERHAAMGAKSAMDISKIIVDQAGVVETSFAWVLPWNDRRYLEHGDRRYDVDGRQPLVVLKCDGTVMILPTLTKAEYSRWNSTGPFGSIEHRIASLAEKLGYGEEQKLGPL
jgi:hypothetical protein